MSILPFWKPTQEHGYFSQWFFTSFRSISEEKLPEKIQELNFVKDGFYKKVENYSFNTSEQFMMASKAILFDDIKSFDMIMKEMHPKKQKEFGRYVSNFDNEVWFKYCMDIVILGNYFKFTQNKELMEKLISTKGKTLVEASPYDKIWGIGIALTDKRCYNFMQWKGENKLGKCLMCVRDICLNS